MKQYCRYCCDAVLTENENIVYCEAKKETRHKKKCITPNKCKYFKFNELDVFDIEKKYTPRVAKRKGLENQIELEVKNDNIFNSNNNSIGINASN